MGVGVFSSRLLRIAAEHVVEPALTWGVSLRFFSAGATVSLADPPRSEGTDSSRAGLDYCRPVRVLFLSKSSIGNDETKNRLRFST